MHLLLYICCSIIMSSQVGAEKRWYRYDFPSPRNDILKCGRNGTVSYICDPQNLLTTSEANQLDNLIENVMYNTKCPCAQEKCDQNTRGYKIGVALVEKIKSDAEVENKNDDEHNSVDNTLTEAEKFTYTLLTRWSFGECEEDLIIFYSQKDQVLYTMTGDVTKKKLDNILVGEVSFMHRDKFAQGKYFNGLKDMIKDYSLILRNEYVRKTANASGPKSLALVGAGTTSIIPNLFTSLIMAVIIVLLH